MKKYIALLLVVIFALSFMSAAAFADGDVKSPGGNTPSESDKPITSPQTGIGGNIFVIGFIALAVVAADAMLLKKLSA